MTADRPTARDVAVTVLERVATQGAYASLALDAELQRAKLSQRDAGLATEIVYGTLRALPAIDGAITAVLTRPDTKLDPLVQAVLRAGTYQLQYLDRVPAHAIVDSAVTLATNKRGKKAGGFVNALLRKLASRTTHDGPRARLTLPPWLHEALVAGVGTERVASVLSTPEVPGLCLRINPTRTTRQALVDALRTAMSEATITLSPLSALGVLVRGAGDPRSLPGFTEGHFVVQEEGAQVVTLACGARDGEHVLDACAGHGGKATWFAHAVGATGSVTALDLHERKLERLRQEAVRMGLNTDAITTAAVDLTVGTGGLDARFDRVVVDAPCTGTGTLLRRPELAMRLRPEDPQRLATLQRAIIERAATLLKPGGVFVYAICSLTRAEGVDVVRALDPALLQPCGADTELPIKPDDDGLLRVGAWCGDGKESTPDGYQLAWFRRPLRA